MSQPTPENPTPRPDEDAVNAPTVDAPADDVADDLDELDEGETFNPTR